MSVRPDGERAVTAPKRIQRRRTKGWRMPDGVVYVGRGTRWGNQYRVGDLVQDPVNSSNPVAAPLVHPVFLGVGTHRRRDVRGHEWTMEVYRIGSSAVAVDLFRRLYEFEGVDVSALRGRDLACWCPLDSPCHADVLLDLANRSPG